jgi:hypothetical protein
MPSLPMLAILEPLSSSRREGPLARAVQQVTERSRSVQLRSRAADEIEPGGRHQGSG